MGGLVGISLGATGVIPAVSAEGLLAFASAFEGLPMKCELVSNFVPVRYGITNLARYTCNVAPLFAAADMLARSLQVGTKNQEAKN